jgi:Flp pilus assembly protein TadB
MISPAIAAALALAFVSAAIIAFVAAATFRDASSLAPPPAGSSAKPSGIAAYFSGRRRRKAFDLQVLDFVVGLENGMRGGQALQQAVESMSRRMDWPMAEELATVLRETRLGTDITQAIDNLRHRMPCEDLTLFSTAVRLSSKSGGSLAALLAQIAGTIRQRREFAAKLATLTAQGRFEAIAISSAPFFAFGILWAVNPDLMRPMFHCKEGFFAFLAVFVMEGIGFAAIRKIMSIEV